MALDFETFTVDYTDPKTGKVSRNESQHLFISETLNTIVPKSMDNDEPIYVVLSGARGSGKTVGIQYVINHIALNYPGIKINMSRIALNQIKNNLFKELKAMTPDKIVQKGKKLATSMTYVNGSEVECFGYADGVEKLKGNNCAIHCMEEGTEDSQKNGTFELNKHALNAIAALARDPGYPNIIFILTNPDSPEHHIYTDYIDKAGYVDGKKTKSKKREDNIYVFYSVTTDNKHMKAGFIKNLSKRLTKQMAERYIMGKWIALSEDTIFNEYDDDLHWHPDKEYKIKKNIPIIWTHDFNVSAGTPMSSCILQNYNDEYHIYDECIMQDSNTRGVLEEMESRGFFRQFTGGQELWIMGDAAGWARHSGGEYNDYGLITHFLDHLSYTVNYEIKVPVSNPAIKARHNLCNIYLKNLLGEVRVFIYKDAEGVRKGLRSTKLKKGATYKEIQSYYQHVTTAMGYALWMSLLDEGGFQQS